MTPFKGKMLRIVEQLSPVLPGTTADVVKAALGVGTTSPADPRAQAGWPSCLGQPAVMPDLSALMGRRAPLHKPTTPPASRDAGPLETRSLSTPVGPMTYKLFQPGGRDAPTALVVMLHGCSQDAADFAAGTGMNTLAARENLLVVYPEQSRSANMNRCWNWFLPANQSRDLGEAAAIAAVTRAVMQEFDIAPGRVLVAGLSAGGAMAAIMAEAYPDLFGAVGIHSGLRVGAAHDMGSAFSAMRQGPMPGSLQTSAHPPVPTIVIHGTADTTVDPRNAAAIAAPFTTASSDLRCETAQEHIAGRRDYVRTIGRDRAGHLRFESWLVSGAGHAWSGGTASGSYTDPAGPDASAAMVRFFLDQIAVAPAIA